MADFAMSRSTTINAPADRVHSHLNDFREWKSWSPWEGLDPDLKRTFTGPETGVGSHYAWAGNKKAGEGTMEITGSTPSRLEIALEFLVPFKASNITIFDLAPVGGGATKVTWQMTGQRGLLMSLMGKLYFDKAIGKDFDKGLASLKAVSEAR
jgi:Polyketide cyclase / dehydrase and lipid transport